MRSNVTLSVASFPAETEPERDSVRAGSAFPAPSPSVLRSSPLDNVLDSLLAENTFSNSGTSGTSLIPAPEFAAHDKQPWHSRPGVMSKRTPEYSAVVNIKQIGSSKEGRSIEARKVLSSVSEAHLHLLCRNVAHPLQCCRHRFSTAFETASLQQPPSSTRGHRRQS